MNQKEPSRKPALFHTIPWSPVPSFLWQMWMFHAETISQGSLLGIRLFMLSDQSESFDWLWLVFLPALIMIRLKSDDDVCEFSSTNSRQFPWSCLQLMLSHQPHTTTYTILLIAQEIYNNFSKIFRKKLCLFHNCNIHREAFCIFITMKKHEDA